MVPTVTNSEKTYGNFRIISEKYRTPTFCVENTLELPATFCHHNQTSLVPSFNRQLLPFLSYPIASKTDLVSVLCQKIHIMSAAVAPAPTPPPTTTTFQTESSSSAKYMTGVLTSPPVVTLTAYIPTAAVGAVIGRRGQNVEDLQRRAAQSATTRQPVRVSVVGHDLKHSAVAAAPTAALSSSPTSPSFGGGGGGATEGGPSATTLTPTTTTTPSSSSLPYTYSALDFSDPAWTPVVIRADVEAALAAGRGLSDACNGKLDQVVLDIPLTRHRHASIIGQFGRTIAKLSADHVVRIMVPHKESRMDLIQLEGDLENVTSCLMEILRIASRHGNNNSNSNNPGNKQQRDDSSLPADSLTVATAPTQTKIRNIAKKTGTTIKKKKSDDNTAAWELIVTGKTTDQVAAAMALLRKWRDEGGASDSTNNNATAAQGRKGKPGGGGGGRGRQNNNNNKGTPKRGGGKNNNNTNTPRTPASSENN